MRKGSSSRANGPKVWASAAGSAAGPVWTGRRFGMRRRRLLTSEPPGGTSELIQHVVQVAFPFEGPADLDPLLGRSYEGGRSAGAAVGAASSPRRSPNHWMT